MAMHRQFFHSGGAFRRPPIGEFDEQHLPYSQEIGPAGFEGISSSRPGCVLDRLRLVASTCWSFLRRSTVGHERGERCVGAARPARLPGRRARRVEDESAPDTGRLVVEAAEGNASGWSTSGVPVGHQPCSTVRVRGGTVLAGRGWQTPDQAIDVREVHLDDNLVALPHRQQVAVSGSYSAMAAPPRLGTTGQGRSSVPGTRASRATVAEPGAKQARAASPGSP